jgi:hypothetical protein
VHGQKSDQKNARAEGFKLVNLTDNVKLVLEGHRLGVKYQLAAGGKTVRSNRVLFIDVRALTCFFHDKFIVSLH